jgi:hypothetical protein
LEDFAMLAPKALFHEGLSEDRQQDRRAAIATLALIAVGVGLGAAFYSPWYHKVKNYIGQQEASASSGIQCTPFGPEQWSVLPKNTVDGLSTELQHLVADRAVSRVVRCDTPLTNKDLQHGMPVAVIDATDCIAIKPAEGEGDILSYGTWNLQVACRGATSGIGLQSTLD